ncbi:MAG: molybdate ABC transporter substrate-binding protein, partial [Actinomycetes bacterium]
VLPAIGDAFVTTHSNVEVRYSFAGSQELVAQVETGVPADVLTLAGTSTLRTLGEKVGDPVIFARNRLTIIVPTGNSAGVTEIADLADPTVKVALAGPEVPAGIYSAEAFDKAAISVNPVSEESDVRAVITRVSLGGADAGVVYRTDAAATEADIETVPIARRFNVIASYPAVALVDGKNSNLGQEFVDFLTTDEAQKLLNEYGFEAP